MHHHASPCANSTPKTNDLLLPIELLPRRSLGFCYLFPRSTRPSFDSAPNIARRLRSVVSYHAASTSSPIRTSASTSRQASKHASSPLRFFLLIQASSLRGAHFLREQVLLVACWVVRRHGGLRIDRAEVDSRGCLLWSSTGRRGRVCRLGRCVVDLRRRSIEGAALACSWWRRDAACLCGGNGHGTWLGRGRDGILCGLGGACRCWLGEGSCAWNGWCCCLRCWIGG